jgi:ElaB/YqjD/DUF883 family membrane-anchored ribosome-binding protein
MASMASASSTPSIADDVMDLECQLRAVLNKIGNKSKESCHQIKRIADQLEMLANAVKSEMDNNSRNKSIIK